MNTKTIFAILTLLIGGSVAGGCPESIKATVPGFTHKGQWGMVALHRRLLECPDLKSLDLRVTLLGCSEWPDRWNLPFRLVSGERYPNLTSLKLEGYEFNHSDWYDAVGPAYSEPFLTWLEYSGLQRWLPLWMSTPLERRHWKNLDLWLEAADWSQLERLEIRDRPDPYFTERAAPHLTNLKHLTFVESERHPETEPPASLAAQLPEGTGLESLSWLDGRGHEGLEDILKRHGSTLKRFEAYSTKPEGGNALSATQIQSVVEQAPGLEHISVVLHRDGSWPWAELQALAGLPSLRSAGLWLELPSDCMRGADDMELRKCASRFRRPLLNESSAEDVFTFMNNERGRSQASELDSVTFYLGDWERPWDGPLMFPPWDDGMALKIVCGNPVENNHGVPGGGSKCVETASWGLAKNPDNRWLEGGLVGNEQRELDQMQAQMEM